MDALTIYIMLYDALLLHYYAPQEVVSDKGIHTQSYVRFSLHQVLYNRAGTHHSHLYHLFHPVNNDNSACYNYYNT